MNELVDLETHRIEGYLPDGREISIPLYTEIEFGLWMGGCPPTFAPEFPDAILNLYGATYVFNPTGQTYLEHRLHDWGSEPDAEVVTALSQWVHDRREEGKVVLVHCQAGLNRSGLVTSYYLMRHRGMGAEDAIALLRERRSELVLCNEVFEDWLLQHEPVMS